MSVQSLRWAVADGRVLTGRALAHWARRPGDIAMALLFPVMVVLMMGYLFGGQMDVPGGGNYREFIVPGMFALTMAFGVETTFTAIASDAAKGWRTGSARCRCPRPPSSWAGPPPTCCTRSSRWP